MFTAPWRATGGVGGAGPRCQKGIHLTSRIGSCSFMGFCLCVFTNHFVVSVSLVVTPK